MNPIEKRVSEGYELNTFLLYQSVFLSYRNTFLMITVVFLLGLFFLFLLSLFGIILYYGDPVSASQALENLDPTDLPDEFVWWSFVANIILSGILGIFSAGFINTIKADHQLKAPAFSTLFKYFTNWSGLKVFVFSLVFQLIISVSGIFLQSYGLDLVQLFIMILGHTLTVLVIPFIIFHKLSVWKAVKYSTQLVNLYSIRIIALVLFYVMLSFAGLFLFIIGVLFTLPILYAFKYHLYHQIIFQEQDGLEN